MLILNTLYDNYKYITNTYNKLVNHSSNNQRIVAACEWLIDNYYIIEDVMHNIKSSFSSKIISKLPLGVNGYARIYNFAKEVISNCPDKLSEDYLIISIDEYQKKCIFLSSELWMLPIFLKVVIIANIKNLCVFINKSHNSYKNAYNISNRLVNGEKIELITPYLTPVPDDVFIESLVYFLKGHSNKNESILKQLDVQLDNFNISLENLIANEYESQANGQIKIGKHVGSLIALLHIEWAGIFEKVSVLEKVLSRDPANIYNKMDYKSRDYYRNSLLKIAKKYRLDEIKVAVKAVQLSNNNRNDDIKSHVGYYLCDDGIKPLLSSLGKKYFSTIRYRSALYITFLVLSTLIISGMIGFLTNSLIGCLISIPPIFKIVIGITNFIIGHIIKPTMLPKLDLDELDINYPTVVIVPTLLTSAEAGANIIDNLETYYLANKKHNLKFALVGDFRDRNNKNDPMDEQIVARCLEKVTHLNKKYNKEIFFYYQRSLIFSLVDKKHMGYERKRGAIMEFNALLLGKKNTDFFVISGDIGHVDYVITLDADTKLPPDTAKKLIGTMVHPLNRAVIDTKKNIVVKGYGILQPRIGVDLESANKSIFSRIFAGQGGIDPYSTVSSDVYQDLFGESIFTGKGIYDLKVFNQVLEGAIADNKVLSHDLLEGSYSRCGFVSDIELIDGYPARYNSYSSREHRWIRGDVQLLPWLFGHVKDKFNNERKNPLNLLSRWKIFDNLRRVITPIFVLILIILCFGPFKDMHIFMSIALISLLFPVITYLMDSILLKYYIHVGEKLYAPIIYGFRGSLYQALILLILLPFTAYNAICAVFTALYRIFISKRKMLEWVTAADSEKTLGNGMPYYYYKMFFSPLVAILGLGFLFLPMPPITFIVPFSLLWVIAPFIAYNISQPYKYKEYQLSLEDRIYLGKTARRIWRYFEDFIKEGTHYIPPDNFQENPSNGAANRTSPTNIGITFTSVLSAYEMGYITKLRFLDYITKLISTIDKMDKWNGHLYNWYDTLTLKTLNPPYISTVDSGNFIGYLIVLREAIIKIKKQGLLDNPIKSGLIDTINLCAREGYKFDTSVQGSDFGEGLNKLLSQIEEYKGKSAWLHKLKEQIEEIQYSLSLNKDMSTPIFDELLLKINLIIDNTDFTPLYLKSRSLFSIGYNVGENKLTDSCYDLIASEARQSSFIAIAKGDIPAKHWFKMSRTLVSRSGYRGLVSWSGTMFEYFMPRLIMKNIKNSMFDETYKFVADSQIKYGKHRNVPWGVSESAFAAFDMQLNYQYKAFGIPALGFKSGLNEDTVIAPYSSILGLMESPKNALANLRNIKSIGGEGLYGFYEAIDYTPNRQLRGHNYTIVKSYMVHHLGMSMLSLTNVLHNNIMQAYFHSAPEIRSIEYLLHERVPIRVKTHHLSTPVEPIKKLNFAYESAIRKINYGNPILPSVQLLSNSTFCTMVDENGCGYSKSNKVMFTRFRDSGDDNLYGCFFYINNLTTGECFSPSPLPIGDKKYITTFYSHMARFTSVSKNINVCYDIGISPESSLEVRRIELSNTSNSIQTLEVTSYLEPSLTKMESDIAHMAFSKLFISTKFDSAHNALLAIRPARDENENDLVGFHKLHVEGTQIEDLSFETDRLKFLGRHGSVDNPATLHSPLSNSDGAPIDPILSLRCKISIKPNDTVFLYYISGVANDSSEAINICAKYSRTSIIDDVFELALSRSKVVNKYLSISELDEIFIQQLLSYMIYPHTLKSIDHFKSNTLGKKGLWSHGISGDLPILLYAARSKEDNSNVELLLKAHEYWRLRGYASDLAILTNDSELYRTPVHTNIRDIINSSTSRELLSRPGGVFLIEQSNITEAEINLFYTVSRISLNGKSPLIKQLILKNLNIPEEFVYKKPIDFSTPPIITPELDFYNEYGGFNTTDNEYVITLKNKINVPLPWVNVVANDKFGFIVSEFGGGYSWYDNSRENKLTPWSNDYVMDNIGECVYIRDDESGNVWTLTSGPIRDDLPYLIRHGFGYSSFSHNCYGMISSLTSLVADLDPIKLNLISLTNSTNRKRTLSLFYYTRSVMGADAQGSTRSILISNDNNALVAQNVLSDSTRCHMFISTNEKILSFSGCDDEKGYISKIDTLSNCIYEGYNPALLFQVKLELAPLENKEIVFTLGASQRYEDARELIAKYNDVEICKKELEIVKTKWKTMLGGFKVSTPNTDFNIMMNGRLIYQTYVCRMLARAGFYQTSGAFGFRDQLQDSSSLVWNNPDVTKNQILFHAAHQFKEGDVQHWWHNPAFGVGQSARGIRTRFSDNLVWLPYLTCEYIEKTEDYDILDAQIPFLIDSPLCDGENERYGESLIDEISDSLYMHCILALDKALKYGSHGIPLMGSGDWNDGMNKVGNKGQGESIWLGFFLYATLSKFIELCEKRGDMERHAHYSEQLEKICSNIEENAWDGQWYRRAYFDNGACLGSHNNSECKIDSIAQSWSVISKCAPESKGMEAIFSAENHLVDYETGISLLLSPPFTGEEFDPGYIKSYIPGVRENGGQYSHAAVWLSIAFAIKGDGDRAFRLFSMVNPINHTITKELTDVYKAEPYAVAADIYNAKGHKGRGGWSWYTGASAWLYKAGIEYILGFKKHGNTLKFEPSFPLSWDGFNISYTFGSAVYNINVMRGENKLNPKIILIDDGQTHDIEIVI